MKKFFEVGPSRTMCDAWFFPYGGYPSWAVQYGTISHLGKPLVQTNRMKDASYKKGSIRMIISMISQLDCQ